MRTATAHRFHVVGTPGVTSVARRLRMAPVLRQAVPIDAAAIHTLVLGHLGEGHLLPRRLEDIQSHITRFVVAADGPRVVACAELSPLDASVAEVRSLVVSAQARTRGVGQALVNELSRRAREAGFAKLCAFAHAPSYFVHMGFSIIPHTWLPAKIEKDCRSCAQFRACGQYAVVRELCQ